MITLLAKEGDRTYLNKCINSIDVVRDENGKPIAIHVWQTNGNRDEYEADYYHQNWKHYQDWLEAGE